MGNVQGRLLERRLSGDEQQIWVGLSTVLDLRGYLFGGNDPRADIMVLEDGRRSSLQPTWHAETVLELAFADVCALPLCSRMGHLACL